MNYNDRLDALLSLEKPKSKDNNSSSKIRSKVNTIVKKTIFNIEKALFAISILIAMLITIYRSVYRYDPDLIGNIAKMIRMVLNNEL